MNNCCNQNCANRNTQQCYVTLQCCVGRCAALFVACKCEGVKNKEEMRSLFVEAWLLRHTVGL